MVVVPVVFWMRSSPTPLVSGEKTYVTSLVPAFCRQIPGEVAAPPVALHRFEAVLQAPGAQLRRLEQQPLQRRGAVQAVGDAARREEQLRQLAHQPRGAAPHRTHAAILEADAQSAHEDVFPQGLLSTNGGHGA